MRRKLILLILFFSGFFLKAQNYSKKDSLRGTLSDIRSCYDVIYYDLNISIDDVKESIGFSTNVIYFKALSDFNHHNTKGLIFDLRNNGGGSLKDAIDIDDQPSELFPLIVDRITK